MIKENKIFEFSDQNFQILSYPVGSYEMNSTLLFHKESKAAMIFDPGENDQLHQFYIHKFNLKPQMIVQTHAHFDHILIAQKLCEQYSIPLLLHEQDDELYQSLPIQLSFFGMESSTIKTKKLDTFLEESDELLYDFETKSFIYEKNHSREKKNESLSFSIFHTPGHTLGHCCFYLSNLSTKIAICGDVLFKRSIGRTDLPGGNYQDLISSIKNKLYTLPKETIVIPGHGPTTTIGEEMIYNPYVRADL